MCHHLYDASKRHPADQAHRTGALQDTREQHAQPIELPREHTERDENERRVELDVE